MADTPTNSQGDEIIVDPGTPEEDRAEHPSGQPEKKDDQISGAVFGDAELNDPPLRTNRPDVPIIQRLGTGAGEHKPVTDENYDGMRFTAPDAAGEEPKRARSTSRKSEG